jgi:hypothetical protein
MSGSTPIRAPSAINRPSRRRAFNGGAHDARTSLDRSIHATHFGAFGDEKTAGEWLTAQVAAFFDWLGQG